MAIFEEDFSLKDLCEKSMELKEELKMNSPLIGDCMFIGNSIAPGDDVFGPETFYLFKSVFRVDDEDWYTEAWFDKVGRYCEVPEIYTRRSIQRMIFKN